MAPLIDRILFNLIVAALRQEQRRLSLEGLHPPVLFRVEDEDAPIPASLQQFMQAHRNWEATRDKMAIREKQAEERAFVERYRSLDTDGRAWETLSTSSPSW